MTGRAGLGVVAAVGDGAPGAGVATGAAVSTGEISAVAIFSVGIMGVCSFNRYFLLTTLMRFSF